MGLQDLCGYVEGGKGYACLNMSAVPRPAELSLYWTLTLNFLSREVLPHLLLF